MSSRPFRPESSYRHNAVYPTGKPRCPVCNKDVYSRSGIHPQCAVERNNRETAALQRAEALIGQEESHAPSGIVIGTSFAPSEPRRG